MKPIAGVKQLKATGGGDTVTIDITSAQRTASFNFETVDAKMGSHWNYAQFVRFYVRTQVDQPAAGGSIIRPDQLYRIIASTKLFSDDLGNIYQPGNMTGPELGLIAQVVSRGYALPWHLRDDIAAADGDTAITLIVDLPIGHACFYKGHQTGIWNGFFKNSGQVDLTLAASNCLDAVSTGALLEATTDVRAELHYTTEPEARPPTIWHWRRRETPGGETKHAIKNLCEGEGIKGATGLGKVAFLAYLSDLAGLGGADGIDNITSVYLKSRNIDVHDLTTPFFGTSAFMSRFVSETRRHNVFPVAQGHSYPYQLGTQINGSPAVATALFLPYFWPDPTGHGQEVSALQEWSGNYNLEHGYTATPAGVGRWFALEQSYLVDDHIEWLMRQRMGLPPEVFSRYAKVRGLHSAGDQVGALEQAKKLRGIPQKIRRAA